MNLKYFSVKLLAALGLILVTMIAQAQLADANTTRGILHVAGEPDSEQANYVFLLKCQADAQGQPVKFSCDQYDLPGNPDESLNQDISLTPGLYAVFYDRGAMTFATIEAGQRVDLQLEKIDLPDGVDPRNVGVFLDLTDPVEQANFLRHNFAVDSRTREGCLSPLLEKNLTACAALNNGKTPEDFRDTLIKFDTDGEPLFWNFYHQAFIGSDKSLPCDGLRCIDATSTGKFVSVFHGTYGLVVYENGALSFKRGIVSRK